MKNYWLAAGLLLNAALIVINRFLFPLPDWLCISGLVLGIVCIITGAVKAR